MTDDVLTGGRMHLPRTRGALSGIALIVLGAWGGLAPFIGPYFDFAYTPQPGTAWHWTAARGWFEVLPGGVALLGGLLLLVSANRAMTSFGAWIAIVAGGWFVIGPLVAPLLTLGTIGDPANGGQREQVAIALAFFTALGAVIVLFGALAAGRLSVHSVRDARVAARREAEERETEREDTAEQPEREQPQRRDQQVGVAPITEASAGADTIADADSEADVGPKADAHSDVETESHDEAAPVGAATPIDGRADRDAGSDSDAGSGRGDADSGRDGRSDGTEPVPDLQPTEDRAPTADESEPAVTGATPPGGEPESQEAGADEAGADDAGTDEPEVATSEVATSKHSDAPYAPDGHTPEVDEVPSDATPQQGGPGYQTPRRYVRPADQIPVEQIQRDHPRE